jgi:type I restriction enzyme M protein
MAEQAAARTEPEATDDAGPGRTAVPDNMLVDYVTGKIVPDTAKERVRQHIARALFHEYEISVEDMERDFPITVDTDG